MSFFKSLFNKSVSTLQSNPVNQAINQTFNNVQNNLRETVKEIEESVKETPLIRKDLNLESFRLLSSSSSQIPPSFYNQQVELNSGVVLSQLYQADVSLLKQNNTKVVKQSDATDAKVVIAVQIAQYQVDSFNKFTKELETSLPEFTSTVARMNRDIDFLCCRIEKLENVLTQQLEDCSIQRIQNFDLQQSQETAKFRAKKQTEYVAADQNLKNEAMKREKMAMEVEKMKIQHSMQQMKLEAQAKERADRIREQEIQLEREKHQAFLKLSSNTPPSTPTSISSPSPLSASQNITEQPIPLKLEEETEKVDKIADKSEPNDKQKDSSVVEKQSEPIVQEEKVEERKEEKEEEKKVEAVNEKQNEEQNEVVEEKEDTNEKNEEEEKETEGEEDEGEDVSGWL
eukprot:TRINITY_DN1717_c0_g1_i1.p1 TRINITY_DN1717_c0_g1~~TRINITY_DN1717_c0_g1_i1.p1  ORF type:complete len:400 (+),score=177.73 TRINITY_DN1717_c0_g1_i1:111-1310(+)